MTTRGGGADTWWGRSRRAVRYAWSLRARRPGLEQVLSAPALEWLRRPDGLAARRVVGRAYLRQMPAERDAALLVRAVDLPAGDVDYHHWLRERVATDFRRNQVVVVSNWVLSATEARIAALVFLVT